MLYTPLLPEAASGTLEPRHVVVPLRLMCPQAELLLGEATALDEEGRTVHVVTEDGEVDVAYEQLVVALGSIARALPVPGLSEHALGFRNLADAIYLRNHVLRELEAAAAHPEQSERHLTFVFIGAGYAGVEALAELSDLVRDALRHYPTLRERPRRWVLVDAAPKILPEIPRRLGEYAARKLAGRGVDIRVSTTLDSVDADGCILSDGTRLESHTVVWTAGVKASPQLGPARPPARRARACRRRPDAARRRARERLGARRQRPRPQRGDARPVRPAHLPARAPPGPPARQEPARRAEAVPLPHARPGGDARPLQGYRRRPRTALQRLPRLVRHPDVPPVPAAALLAQAPRRRRLDGRRSSSAATSPSSRCSASPSAWNDAGERPSPGAPLVLV